MHEFLKKAGGPLVEYTPIPWTRVVMNRETMEWVRPLDAGRVDALEISCEYWKNKAPLKTYRTAWCPEYDVCDKPLPEQFDPLFAEQVFEHPLHPERATRNAFHLLREGDFLLVTAPFLFRIHAFPTDGARGIPQGRDDGILPRRRARRIPGQPRMRQGLAQGPELGRPHPQPQKRAGLSGASSGVRSKTGWR